MGIAISHPLPSPFSLATAMGERGSIGKLNNILNLVGIKISDTSRAEFLTIN